MLTWPTEIPEPQTLPTIPILPQIPREYFSTVAQGRFFNEAFCPTAEPTSESPDGVTLHALAVPGARLYVPDAPRTLVPFAQDLTRYFCFDFNTPGPAIRYLDIEVDQWLTLAPDWLEFKSQLQARPLCELPETMSEQALAHALLTSRGSALKPLLLVARERFAINVWLDWLFVLSTEPTNREVLTEELDFARRYLWQKFDDEHRAKLGMFTLF